MKILLIGHGEVGAAVHKYFIQYYEHIDIIDHELVTGVSKGYDFMLVCIPYTSLSAFLRTIRGYKSRFKCRNIIVFSTVPIGTCEKLYAAHVPIEGRHPNLYESLKKWDIFLGYDGYNLKELVPFFIKADKVPYVFPTRCTELLKLQSTLQYGINIEFARFVNDMCSQYGVDYTAVEHYNKCYNKLYSDDKRINRYVLLPPNGKIGGHCVVPNCDILDQTNPSLFTKLVKEGYKCSME